MNTNQTQEIRQISDIRKIEDLMHGIIGEVCWGTRLSYGDEFHFEIGHKIPNPILKNKEKGSWSLGTRASDWSLYLSNEKLVESTDELDLIRDKIHLMDENRISSFKIGYPKLGLEIMFVNKMILRIKPTWDDDSQLAHWYLMMPNNMFLKVGPASTWSYRRSDIPLYDG
jgi:hypothetical protein